MTRVLIPGSFDPLTRGHLDIVTRAANLFSEVVVGVANNDEKRYLFNLDQRTEIAAKAVESLSNVRVVAIAGLVAKWCRENQVDLIAKGIRNGADWENELVQARANRQINGIETVFLPTAPELAHVSSSLVRQLAKHGQDLSAYVTDNVSDALTQIHAASTTEGFDHD